MTPEYLFTSRENFTKPLPVNKQALNCKRPKSNLPKLVRELHDAFRFADEAMGDAGRDNREFNL